MRNSDLILYTLTKLPRAVCKDDISSQFAEEMGRRKLDAHNIAKIAASIKDEWFPFGALIDLQRLQALLKQDASNIQMMARLSRVKLQGTDGIRGKVDNSEYSKRNALKLYLEKGVLCPAFFSLNAEAFATFLRDKAVLENNDTIVIGEDGRDRLTNATIVPAVIEGLNAAGCKVLDAGIIPTPGVPYASRRWACKAGIIITASHNPSNQNGIKLLHDNFKLMDDGFIGEFGLSKYIYALAEEDLPLGCQRIAKDISLDANELLKSIILKNIDFPEDLKDKAILVYDGANGAFSSMAAEIFKTLPFESYLMNIDALGHNINQDGGVGELEGTRIFKGKVEEPVFNQYFPVIRKIFELGRNPENPAVFGLVNDGDGDRGYLLAYNKAEDHIHVVPGDELASLIIAKKSYEGKLPENAIFVNSVESDIMCAGYIRDKYHIQNHTACVGDKWLLVPARKAEPFVVGCEESGHVTFGVEVMNPKGESGTVFTGNGLLSVLTVLEFILKRKIPIQNIAHPFPPGHKSIRYVYFVDKDRFLPGTEAFSLATAIAEKFLKEKLKPLGYKVKVIDYPDAPEMLYIAAFDSEDIKCGSLFVRNSGTESKTGVAIRCDPSLKEFFESAMDLVHESNARYLKDSNMLEAKQERLILESLDSSGKSDDEILNMIPSLNQNNLDAITYALRKQKLIKAGPDGKWFT